MKDIDKDIKAALDDIQGEAKSKPDKCPEETLLALFIEGKLSDNERLAVVEHLSLCPRCLEAVLLESVESPEKEPAEAALAVLPEALKKVKDLVRAEPDTSLFDLILRFFQGRVQMIHSVLTPLTPVTQPAFGALRADQQQKPSESIRMEKTFDSVSVEIAVTAQDRDLWAIQLFLKDTQKALPIDGWRATLKDLSQHKELQSTIVRQGQAAFLELPGASYGLEIKEKGKIRGELSLRLIPS